MMKTDMTKIKIPILVPLSMVIMVLLGVSVVSIHWLQQRHIDEGVRLHLEGVKQMFQLELKEDAELMNGLADFLQENENLQSAWVAKDREALLSYALPLFENIRSKYRVTHLYFHGLDRVCFLRVHKPQRYGDYIERFTLDKAIREGKDVYGIELGSLGTFTLRAVHPWKINGELVGYIELGEEIRHITAELKEIIGVELFIIVHKSHLNRAGWEEGLKIMGRTGDWDQFPEVVIIDSTMEQIPPVLGEEMERHHIVRKKFLFEALMGGREYRGGFVPLFDAGGRDVGDVIIMRDVTQMKAALRGLTVVLIAVCAVIGGGLVGFFYFFVGRIEQRLVKAYNDLKTEIEEHRRSQEALKAANQQLRASEQQLKAANQQLRANEQQLKAANQQLRANEQQLKAANQQLDATNQQLRASEQQLRASEQQLKAANQQLRANEQQLRAANQQLQASEQQLKAANQQLEAANQQLRASEEELRKLNRKLSERIRELNCLYALSRLIEQPGICLEEILESMVELIPPGWQYPEVTCAQVVFEDREFKTKNFKRTRWMQSADIKVNDKKTGALEVYYLKKRPEQDEGPFLKEERDLIEDLAERLGETIERLRAEEELAKEHSLLRALIDSIPDSIYVKDIESRFIVANAEVARRVGAAEPDELLGKTDFDLHPRELAEQYYADEQELLRTGEAVINREGHVLDQTTGETIWNLTSKVPWRDRYGKIIGIVGVGRDITERKRAEEQTLRQSAVLEAINSVFRETLTCETSEDVAKTCLKVAEELTGSKFGFIGELNQAGLFDTIAISNPGWDACKVPGSTATELIADMEIRGIDRSTLREGKSRIVNDPSSHPDRVGVPKGHPAITCFLGVPLKQADKTIGMIGLANKESGYDPADQQAIESLSVAFVEALTLRRTEEKLLDYQAQLRSLASELSLTEEHERHQIATELHAAIGQSLAISKLRLDALRASASSKELFEALGEVCDSLDESIQNTRSLTFDLSSPILYELGFEAAVAEWLDEQIRKRHGIVTEFEDDGRPKLMDDDIRVFLFRDVRELLINVVKHAQAHKVRVSIHRAGEKICVSVEDDGVGFDVPEVASIATETGGFGLFSIRERLEELGGHLEIESEPGRGCKVTMTAPLKQEQIDDGGRE